MWDDCWDICEYCGHRYEGLFCSCTRSKDFYHEETKKEILNELYQSLRTKNITLKVEGEQWA